MAIAEDRRTSDKAVNEARNILLSLCSADEMPQASSASSAKLASQSINKNDSTTVAIFIAGCLLVG